MKKTLAIAIIIGMFGCGGSDPNDSNSNGATSTSTTATETTSSSSTSVTTSSTEKVLTILEPNCPENFVTGPISTGDGIKVNGVPIHEHGAVSIRCFANPMPDRPFYVTNLFHTVVIAPLYGCSNLADHQVFLQGSDTEFPVSSSPENIYDVKIANINFVGNDGISSVDVADIAISKPWICMGLIHNIVSDSSRSCISICGDQPVETPDVDRWTFVKEKNGQMAPVCSQPGFCFLDEMSKTPTSALGSSFELEKFVLGFHISGYNIK